MNFVSIAGIIGN